MNIKTKILITLIGIVFSVSAFATKNQITVEGESDYMCIIDSERTDIFTGEVLANEQGGQILFIKDKKVIKTVNVGDIGLFLDEDWKKLDDSIAISVSLLNGVPSKDKKMLIIHVSRVNWSLIKTNPLSNSSIAGGVDDRFVVLMDQAQKININCFHKSMADLFL